MQFSVLRACMKMNRNKRRRCNQYWKTYRNVRAELNLSLDEASANIINEESADIPDDWLFDDRAANRNDSTLSDNDHSSACETVLPYYESVSTTCKSDSELSDFESDLGDSEDEDDSDETVLSVPEFLTELCAWSVKHNISRDCFNCILNLIRATKRFEYDGIPKDCRKLLNTPRKLPPVDNIEGGKLVYFGLQHQLEKYIRLIGGNCSAIQIDVNIDGLPLRHKSRQQFWPILCSIVGCKSCHPFMAALFYGKQKPKSADVYMQKFINEILLLVQNGIEIGDVKVAFSVRSFICDAPARAFIKCTVAHNGKHACERCNIVGKSVNRRVVFVSRKFEEYENDRTNDDFRAGKYNNKHVKDGKEKSPLLRLTRLDIIHDVVLDPMHLVNLGVCRRLLFFLKSGPLCVRLSNTDLGNISERLVSYAKFTPSEFARKPRSIFELEYWKATEYRQFLMYTGTVALRGLVSDDCYKLFVVLSVAIRILNISDSVRRTELLAFARQLIRSSFHLECWSNFW